MSSNCKDRQKELPGKVKPNKWSIYTKGFYRNETKKYKH